MMCRGGIARRVSGVAIQNVLKETGLHRYARNDADMQS